MSRTTCCTCGGDGFIPSMNCGYGYMGVCQDCDGSGYNENRVPVSRWNGTSYERIWVPENQDDDDD